LTEQLSAVLKKLYKTCACAMLASTESSMHELSSEVPLTSLVVQTRKSQFTSGRRLSHRSAATSAYVTPPMNMTTTNRRFPLTACDTWLLSRAICAMVG
jgi:hypothetical protein